MDVAGSSRLHTRRRISRRRGSARALRAASTGPNVSRCLRKRQLNFSREPVTLGESRPTGRRRVRRMRADDDAYRAVESRVVPRPAEQDVEAVFEADQVIEVNDEPDDPADEAGEGDRADLSDC